MSSVTLFANPFSIDYYNFVNYNENHIQSFEDEKLNAYFEKLDNLILKGKGKINIVHIGDSHIQGGDYTSQIRKRLQNFTEGMNGGRGFLFPYRLAKTNNPRSFSVRYSGAWTGCRNTERKKNCLLGFAGISATTYSSAASITINLNNSEYDIHKFNKIRVFHNTNTSYLIYLQDSELNKNAKINRYKHYTEIITNEDLTEVTIQLKKSDVGIDNKFVMYGISLDNDEPGIVYHTAGVNGAEVSSYLRCELFSEHLQELKPDLTIISLGTNDAYMSKFDNIQFKMRYDTLITMINEAAPNTAIILATPGDNYRRRRYVNRNNQVAADVMYEIAKEKNLSVWDFYKVMGGFRSVSSWYRSGLIARDYLHFGKRGYQFQGDLLFNAIMKTYDNYISEKYYKINGKIKRY